MRIQAHLLAAVVMTAVSSGAHAQVPAQAAAAPSQAPAAPARIVLPDNVIPSHYDLDFTPDPKAATFKATVAIDLAVKSATRTIELNAANLVFVTAQLSGMPQQPRISYDPRRETATLTFPATVAAGPHTLTIAYSGKINPHAAGLFYLDYDSPYGHKRALYTQFENSDARRFLPCWDEPNRKATFTLHATVAAGGLPLSNTPIDKTEPLAGGLQRVSFGTTPKMSSYLLFFGDGDFERVTRKVNGVDIGVVTQRGDTAQASFALDAAAHILPFYEDYFGVKFPLPKLDLIAAPGSSQFFGAMENWGANFYFSRDLLIDPKISTQADRVRVYTTVAHEMAHQWFGDLVTMDWWDDLWLNEGFAEWMEYKATDRFHPEWNVWLQALGEKESAFAMDSRAGTHPIIQPIRDVLQANEAFDTITYYKGMSVIRMLENYVGEDAFRAGVRNYIKAHAYGNTVTDDLWRELDKTAATPVSTIAHEFTLQAGVPLIKVRPTAAGIELRQERFATDDSGAQATLWHVPVIVGGAGSGWRGTVERGKPVTPSLPAAAPLVNAGQAGYYRTLYAPAQISALSARFAQLPPIDQLGLLHDSRSLGLAGYAPLPDSLRLAQSVTPAMDPLVQLDAASQLAGLARLYRGLPGKPAFDAFARGVLQPLLAQVGWTPGANESGNTTLLRTELLTDLGAQFDDPAVIAKARELFSAWVRNPGSLTADLRSPVLAVVAMHADATTWEQIHQLAKRTHEPAEKEQLYATLGQAQDPALTQRALDLVLTDEIEITERPNVISAVADWYPDLAFDFAVAHLATVNSWLEPDSRNQYEAHLLSGSVALDAVAKLKAYAAAHIPPNARRPALAAQAAIAYRVRVRRERIPDVDRWLQSRH